MKQNKKLKQLVLEGIEGTEGLKYDSQSHFSLSVKGVYYSGVLCIKGDTYDIKWDHDKEPERKNRAKIERLIYNARPSTKKLSEEASKLLEQLEKKEIVECKDPLVIKEAYDYLGGKSILLEQMFVKSGKNMKTLKEESRDYTPEKFFKKI